MSQTSDAFLDTCLFRVISTDNPAPIDHIADGINRALIVDETLRWREAEGLLQHGMSQPVIRVLDFVTDAAPVSAVAVSVLTFFRPGCEEAVSRMKEKSGSVMLP